MAVCQACAEDNPARARFCLACGALMPVQGSGAGAARKTVTMIFADLVESSRLGERLDPESLRQVLARYFREMQRVLTGHGGLVEKFIGDAVMAVFGIPTLHEDDASRAVRAAAAMHQHLAVLNQELARERGVTLQMRVGVNTGEVVTGDPAAGQLLVTGEAVNLAARLQQAAAPGQTLLGTATYELVWGETDVEPVDLPAGSGRQRRAYRLRALLPAAARRLSSPMVGRDDEIALLRQLFRRAARGRICHLLTLLGPAGIGKTRLATEFLAGVAADATVLEGRCLPYGEGITYRPVAEMIRQAAGITDDDPADRAVAKLRDRLEGDDRARIVEQLVRLLGLDGDGRPDPAGTVEETFRAVRQLLASLAANQPLVVLIDDLQWAEPTLLDLIEHVADWTRDTPLLLVCTARGELLEHRPTWSGGRHNAVTLQLEPLDTAACEQLISNLLGTAELPPGARAQIVVRAEGNPLFVEELLSMLIDGGGLRRDPTAWVATTDLAAISVPPTIQALLAARLDQLSLGERAIMQHAAVIGTEFPRDALAEVVPPELRAGLDQSLERLTRKELIRPHAETGGEPVYRFRHALIRDAAYRGLAITTRAQVHERLADWLAREPAGASVEQEEILGFHLEQASRYRASLEPATDEVRALADRAVERLTTAADRAWARGDVPAVVKLLSRAAELTADQDPASPSPARALLLLRLGAALRQAGDLPRAAAVLDEAVTAAHRLGAPDLHAFAVIERALLTLWTDRDASAERLRDDIEQAIRLLHEVGDNRGLARAWGLLSEVRFFQGQMGAANAALERALEHADRAGDRRQAARLAGRRILVLAYGAAPVADVVASVEEVLAAGEAEPDPVVEAAALAVLAVARAATGRHEEARALHDRAARLFADLGLKAMAAWQASGRVHLLADDLAGAEQELRHAYARIAELGQHNYRSVVAANLAKVLYAQRRYREAGEFSAVSRDTSASDSALAQLLWRGAHARVLARRGRLDQALRLAREAVALAEGTDVTETTADVHTDLAEVLRLAGRGHEATAPLRHAVALYRRKGILVLANRTELLLAALTDPAGASPSAVAQ